MASSHPVVKLLSLKDAVGKRSNKLAANEKDLICLYYEVLTGFIFTLGKWAKVFLHCGSFDLIKPLNPRHSYLLCTV